ncbi:MAG: DUF2167 domain-containing protein [Muribaculaceae bacterium]|nr:DUF2167 domain-containing protein [Muribaculaceae bacterium]
MRIFIAILFSIAIFTCNGQILPTEQKGINAESGYIRLSEAPISINVPMGFVFINGEDTRQILTDYCGNTQDAVKEVVGMMIPDTTSNVEYLDKAYLISYRTPGHVNDDKMSYFSFKKLLQTIQSSLDNSNSIVGWAWTPEYDMTAHRLSLPLMYITNGTDTLFTGKQLIFGKDGLVEIVPISSLSDLQWVYNHETEIAYAITYNSGSAYSDFTGKPDEARYLSVSSFLYNRPNISANSEVSTDDNTPLIPSVWIIIFCIGGAILALLWFAVLFTNSKDETRTTITRISTNVLFRMGVFISLYILSILLGAFLIWFSVRVAIWALPMIGVFGIFLIKPLFQFSVPKDPNRIEINREDAPDLYELIEETAKLTGVKFPKRVYVSSDVNACVFYNTTFWNIFFPVRKNIEIGLGLLYGLNTMELKAVIAHEFGHFGQNSMKIGSIVSIGYEIIENLINRRDFLDKWLIDWQTSNAHWVWSLLGAITASSIGCVRKIMYRTYIFVQKGFLGLSRQMEYDADNVSADIVGNAIAVSALCKINYISKRFEAYHSLVSDIASSKNLRPSSYWDGYEAFITLCESFDGKNITPIKLMEEQDIERVSRRVQIKNPWLSHPTLSQRISRIKSTNRISDMPCLTSATDIVPLSVYKVVSDNLFNLTELAQVSDSTNGDYTKLLSEEFSERSFPLEHRPFLNRDLFGGFNPNDPDIQKGNGTNPFTEENKKILDEFSTAISDYHVMVAFQRGELDEKIIRYNDIVYRRKNVPVDQQEKVVNLLSLKVSKIDREVFDFAITCASDRSLIIRAYDNIFYSQFIIEKINYNLYPNRNALLQELSRVTTRDENEFDTLQRRLVGYKNAIKEAIPQIEMERLYPVIHVDMWKRIQDFLDEDLLLDGLSISSEEITDVFSVPDQLVELYENLAYYSKKIISDTIDGKTPLMAWNNSMALKIQKEDTNS